MTKPDNDTASQAEAETETETSTFDYHIGAGVAFAALLIFYIGIGMLIHLVFIGSELRLASAATWGVLLAWPILVGLVAGVGCLVAGLAALTWKAITKAET